MLKRLYFLFTVFLVNLMCCTAVNGAERSVEDQPQIFTNQDIEKYKGPSEVKATTDTRTVSRYDMERARNYEKQSIREDREKEYWCKKASAYKKKIKKADDDVKETEREIVQEGSNGGKKTAQLQKKLEKARKKVEYAEADLGELEDEAHRKGVPPGWLRCQK